MNKEEILSASRKENGDKDLVELEVAKRAGHYALRVGATVCCVLSLLSLWIADTFIYSPWVIYFSLLATNWFVRHRLCFIHYIFIFSISCFGRICRTFN